MNLLPDLELNDGHPMPQVGYGTSHVTDADTIVTALHTGYRLIDTAASYGNEEVVGEAVRTSGAAREEVFVTTKIRGSEQGYEPAQAALRGSLQRLGLDYVDLCLIHWPLPRLDLYADTWKALIELRSSGLSRSIGVSNFAPEHLSRIIHDTGVVPAVNQIELHPWFPQAAQRAYDGRLDIVTQGWYPLSRGRGLLNDPVVLEVADKHGVTAGQATLRWHTQCGSAPIPRSGDPTRMAQNLDLGGFALDADDLAAFASLDEDRRLGGDPATHEEF